MITVVLPPNDMIFFIQFSTNETAKFKCMCGAANCRGTLAPKSREDDSTEDVR